VPAIWLARTGDGFSFDPDSSLGWVTDEAFTPPTRWLTGQQIMSSAEKRQERLEFGRLGGFLNSSQLAGFRITAMRLWIWA